MKLYGRRVVFATVSLLVVGCSGGGLTREKALSLLQEQGKNFEPASSQRFTMRTDIWIPQANIENQQNRLAVKNFYDALQREGFLTSPRTQQHILAYDLGTDFYYFPIAGPDIETHRDARITVVVARGRFAEVTGLTGEGVTCQAEVRVEVNPTETFKRMDKVYKMLKQPYIDEWIGPWPAEGSLHSSKTITVSFQKYDDGWRVAGLPSGGGFVSQSQVMSRADSTMMHEEAVIRAMPNLDLVASDPQKQTLTIRDKTSNEVVTVTAEDIRTGRFKLKGSPR
jgi:hypothetical protein